MSEAVNSAADFPVLVAHTADIVATFAANQTIDASALPGLISSVHAALSSLGAEPAAEVQEKPQPAVSIRSSVKDDYIVCLEDGKRFKTLRRHLRTAYGMTPEEYRAKWGLPASYPMTAPGYSTHRRQLAVDAGLGRKAEPAPAPAKPARATKAKAAAVQPAKAAEAPKRGRRPAAKAQAPAPAAAPAPRRRGRAKA